MLATERRDLGLDDGSFWPVLEGISATEMFKVIPLSPGHAYGMFMERFNELSELRTCAWVFQLNNRWRGSNEQLNDNKTSRRILWRFNIDGASLEQRKQEDWPEIQARFSRSWY